MLVLFIVLSLVFLSYGINFGAAGQALMILFLIFSLSQVISGWLILAAGFVALYGLQFLYILVTKDIQIDEAHEERMKKLRDHISR